MYYPLVDIFFEVEKVRKLWIPVGGTFCKGSITLRHKEETLRTAGETFEVFLYIDDRETISELKERYGNNLCKWCGVNAYELHYIIEKEWEERLKS